MADPLDHIARPRLPWRDESLTECGKPAASVASVISRDQAHAKVKKQGKQRAAMSTCMTCWNAAERHRDWAASPTEVIDRETNGCMWPQRDDTQLDRELRAIAALVEAYRAEFDGYLMALEDTPRLDSRRQRRVAQ